MPVLELDDGRHLHFAVSGPVPAGSPPVLVFHHGQPGAALIFDGLAAAAARHGLPVVMVSRPGYASSSPQPGRTVADAAADVTAVLDHLDAGRFVTAGWSGGGPHALACAALLAPRCAAAATIAGVAPFHGVEDLDWTAGMGPENVEEFRALIAGDPGLEGRVQVLCAGLATIDAAGLTEDLGGLISPPDRAALDAGFAEYVAGWFRLAASDGHYGYWHDDQAFVSAWGFELDDLPVPVRVWMADQDLMVPASHGEWLCSHIRAAVGELRAGEGHVSLLAGHIDEIVDRLVSDAGPL